MDEMKKFQVHRGHRGEDDALPAYIPWELAETFRKQAYSNHGQTLERLNERGGLSPMEMWWALNNRRWNSGASFEDRRAAHIWVWQNGIE